MAGFDWANWCTRGRYVLLVVGVLLGTLSALLATQLQFDRSIESMFPADSQVLADYHQLKRTFGGNEIVLAVYEDPDLFAENGIGLSRLRTIRQRLAKVDGVKSVLSIDQPLPNDMILRDGALASRTRELFRGFTHSAGGETVSIVCMLFPVDETDVPRQQTIDQMRRIMDHLPAPIDRGYLTGEPIMVVDGFRFVDQDGDRLAYYSMALLGLTIIVSFRSARWAVIPAAVVFLALSLTQAALVVSRIKLSMVSSMLTAVVMVIGVATMVHVMVRFAEQRRMGQMPLEALRSTLRQLLVPIAWACVTDAVGFLSLTVSEVGPVRDFGIMMAIGSVMVLLSVVLLVPGCAVLGRIDPDPHLPWGEDRLTAQLRRVLHVVHRRPWTVLICLLLVIVISASGLGRLDVETDFTRNFRSDSDIARSYRFVEDRLGGAGLCDVMIPAPARLDWEFLSSVYQLEQELDPGRDGSHPFDGGASSAIDMSPITKCLSLADAVVELSPVDLENALPIARPALVTSGLVAMRSQMPVFFDALYGQDPVERQHYLRLMLRVQERQAAEQKQRLIQHLSDESQQRFPGAKVTGYFVLLTNLIDGVVRDQWRSFLVAIGGIGLLMTLAFRDIRLAAIALLPNAFPILVVLGIMGWVSWLAWPALKINMGTAMIAAVSMGLSIDSSIHYILDFRRERKGGATVDESLERVQQRVGKALVLSTFSLAVGFTVLATSSFVPTVYFGVLVTLAMLGGLLGNLIGLPLLIRWTIRD